MIDTALAVLLTMACYASATQFSAPGRPPLDALALLLIGLGNLPLVWRSRAPVSVLAVTWLIWSVYLLLAMEDNLNRFIVPNLAGPARLVPLAALVDEEFSIHALRQAAQRGRLNAIQGADGVWRSSRKSVDAYRASKHKQTKPAKANSPLSQ
ncbi:hypothetical protein ABZW11_41705 [Nonomuraea sp. NPDC004580]|uniref:hypothetical protein n=1 Tax=Nonomuraea sp. NPDC004580 TaxID=3154552 RepID=UPI00339DFAC4